MGVYRYLNIYRNDTRQVKKMKKYIALCVALVMTFMETGTAVASPLADHLNQTVASSLGLGAIAISLKGTPEPGSLFLLGGVLFSLAIGVFLKSAKSSKEF